MRIWSVHPKYLDTKGLVALWRETLLAKNVLEGNTKGYKNHPQLTRFKNSNNPLQSINQYLEAVYQESLKRGYHFNKNKFSVESDPVTLTVSKGQIEYETQHLLKKLKARDLPKYDSLLAETNIESHPLFKIII
jgi:hypothetical protein